MGAMLGSQYIFFMSTEHLYLAQDMLGKRARAGLVGMIGEKALLLGAGSPFTQGEIVTRCEVDA